MNKIKFVLFALICSSIATGCAGGRKSITFQNLQYPVSMSSSLYGPHNEVLVKDKELTTLDTFNYEKKYWGVLYSFVPISGEGDVAEEINKKIKEKGGDGMVNLRVESKSCGWNFATPLLPVPFLSINLLPVTPGCTNAKIQGEIVKTNIE